MFTFDAVADFNSLRREIDRAFDAVRSAAAPRNAFVPARSPRHYPAVNVAEDTDQIVVEALAPGIDVQALNISVLRNQLTISGAKAALAENTPRENVHRSERGVGRFVRTITLPAEVDDSKVRAEYAAGILTIYLPKAEVARPRQIAITVS
jgi:HSP20 family protein